MERAACTLLIFLSCLFLPAADAADLRVGVNSGWMMPYAQIENDHLTDGILFDLYQAIAAVLGMQVRPVVLPRKRIEMMELDGGIDLSCYSNPAWTKSPADFVWSEPVFEITDLLVGQAALTKPGSLDAIPHGAVISTVLGYVYSPLEDRFATGKLRREDTQDQHKVLLKVSAARTPYGITNSHALDWFRHNQPENALANWNIVIERSGFHCSIPRRGVIKPARIIQALNTLKKTGRIDEVLRKYR